MAVKRRRINIFGVNVDDIAEKDALSAILEMAKKKGSGRYVVTVNAEFIMLARKNKKFHKILENADLAVADGWWVAFSRLISGGLEQNRLTGVELVEKLCLLSAEKAVRVGFLGGFSDIAKIVAKRQIKAVPGLKVCFAGPGDPTIGYDLRLKEELSRVGRLDILFVAYGMGKQEFWIDRMKKDLDVGVFIGVGGAFDYLAGVKSRAPKLVQNWGLEWLWRLVLEPQRIWRQRVIPMFFALILLKMMSSKKMASRI